MLQSDKSLRLSGDFKVTVNPVAKLDQYPIPKVEDLFATLGKGKLFSKLDLSHAYQQLLLEDDSMKYVVINIIKGLSNSQDYPMEYPQHQVFCSERWSNFSMAFQM